jgi:beta-glucosidase
MLLINTLSADQHGRMSDKAVRLIEDEKMTRFVFRNKVTATPDPESGKGEGFRVRADVTPYEAAQFMNAIQELAESTRLGIPALFKSNARNHFEHDARAGISVGAGSFSEWPKEAGLAATRDMKLVAEFAQTMAVEWKAIGLRAMYGYMADLATEPRWNRIHETFTEDADLAAEIMTVLVETLQGKALGPKSIALTMKHFPGGGPQEGGGDPHYDFGKNQAYPANNFEYHYKPFKAAIDAGVSSIMPYYGIPVGQKYQPNEVGMAFSKGIVTDLLRKKLGFKGYVNSDTGIIGSRAWGLEDKSVDEQILIAIEAGTDVLSGFEDNAQILNLVTSELLSEDRLDTSVRRLLTEQFQLGLFEDPYVDADRAGYLIGNRAFQKKAEIAQRRSVVLLLKKEGSLPVPASTDSQSIHLYTMGMNAEVVGDKQWSGYTVVSGDYNAEKDGVRPNIPDNTDYAIIRVVVSNKGARRELRFGGANPEELDLLSFSDLAKAQSWHIKPSLTDIQSVMKKIGAEKTLLSIQFRQPYVIDKASGLRDAGAILATFGVSDAAIMDIVTGKFKPSGKLPFALAGNAEAIIKQDPDAPGYPDEDTLYPFGHGLTY